MTRNSFNASLIDFLDASPTPFHAVDQLRALLSNAGFTPLDERESWSLDRGGRHYVVRGDSSLVAFNFNPNTLTDTGWRMVGSHTDSPCLKLKPNTTSTAHGYRQLGVEVYGGVLLNPWFDRDLSIAGRVTLRTPGGELTHRLINFRDPVAVIPSLAIHLDRQANEKRSINPQTYLPAVLGLNDGDWSFEDILLERLVKDDSTCAEAEVFAFDLSLYPVDGARVIGLDEEFIASARLDNLLSVYVSAAALLDGDTVPDNCLIVCNDHEEVGSGSAIGARGTFLRNVLERLSGDTETFSRSIARSVLVSTDNAHGVHPNFSDRHDKAHGPLLNGGPAIKVNSNQAYASTSETAGIFKQACRAADVSVQQFVSRNDMGCGSTIGPITATTLGVKTVDVGVPTFAMHSIRELAGADDPLALQRALVAFFDRA